MKKCIITLFILSLSFPAMAADQYFSINRAAGTPATLREQFEGHIYFSDDKVGIIIFSADLATVTAAVADWYVSKGYHVGFLADTSDAAHAYAVPNASFRAYLRGLATPIDNLQKMISRTGIVANDIGLTGNFNELGLHWFLGFTQYVRLNDNSFSAAPIPVELFNLGGAFTHASSELRLSQCNFTGNLPAEVGKLVTLSYLNLAGNALDGEIPSEIGQCAALKQLILSQNAFTGFLPVEVGTLVNAWQVHVAVNNLTSYVSGTISTNMPVLSDIRFDNNGTAATSFPVADVNQICIDVLANATANTINTGLLNLSGTYMPQPTGAGLAACQSLVDTYSWTVTLHNGVLGGS